MTTLLQKPELSSPRSPRAILWTREDCARLEQANLLHNPYELVEGILNFTGENIRHAGIVRRLLVWLFEVFDKAVVLTQTSIDVHPEDNPTSEPEPDAIVLIRSADEFTQNPTPAEIRLCIEASDSTLTYDLTTKANLYARAGIIEYWVVNATERKLHVHRQPLNGTYQDVVVYSEAEEAAPLAAPQALVRVSELLPRTAVK